MKYNWVFTVCDFALSATIQHVNAKIVCFMVVCLDEDRV